MKKVFVISILLFCIVLCVWSLPFIGAPDPYMVISSGPSISCNASGTYTYYVRETDTTVPSHPGLVDMTISGTAMGLGWIDFKITSITINDSNHLQDAQHGEAPSETIGYMAVVGGVPVSDRAENDDFSHAVSAASWTDNPGTYSWSASGQAVRKIARWDGGQWVVHNDPSDSSYIHTASGSGDWIVVKKSVCSVCKRTNVSSPTEHYVNPCPNAGCQEGGSYWNCYGVPSSHALLATCSNCNATNVYACSGHPDDCTSGSSSSSDLTPNCPDCTSHCSSPCSCTNSGTCNGTVSYHACGDHETSVSGSHSYGTYTCGSHSGYACQESNDHKTYISSCTSTNSDGNTCNNSSAYYECSQHSHTYPPSLVACGGASYTGCSGASSRTEHHVESCSSGCGNGYWTCSPTAVYNHEMPFTCRRCGTSFTRCSNGTCTSDGNTYTYHWAQ